MYEDRRFMIFDTSELHLINFNEVLESDVNSIRKSVDESKSFVKWDGYITPNSVNLLTTKLGPYTYNQIMQILSNIEWTIPRNP